MRLNLLLLALLTAGIILFVTNSPQRVSSQLVTQHTCRSYGSDQTGTCGAGSSSTGLCSTSSVTFMGNDQGAGTDSYVASFITCAQGDNTTCNV